MQLDRLCVAGRMDLANGDDIDRQRPDAALVIRRPLEDHRRRADREGRHPLRTRQCPLALLAARLTMTARKMDGPFAEHGTLGDKLFGLPRLARDSEHAVVAEANHPT